MGLGPVIDGGYSALPGWRGDAIALLFGEVIPIDSPHEQGKAVGQRRGERFGPGLALQVGLVGRGRVHGRPAEAQAFEGNALDAALMHQGEQPVLVLGRAAAIGSVRRNPSN